VLEDRSTSAAVPRSPDVNSVESERVARSAESLTLEELAGIDQSRRETLFIVYFVGGAALLGLFFGSLSIAESAGMTPMNLVALLLLTVSLAPLVLASLHGVANTVAVRRQLDVHNVASSETALVRKALRYAHWTSRGPAENFFTDEIKPRNEVPHQLVVESARKAIHGGFSSRKDWLTWKWCSPWL
jgi:hypothetical protein